MRKWQNLINKKCPDCGGELKIEKDKAVLLACQECEFFITKNKVEEILKDETHMIWQYIHPSVGMSPEYSQRILSENFNIPSATAH